MPRKYRLTTLGCKVNQYESQQLRELLDSLGCRPARRGETPDFAVVNTCAVTSAASRKNRQAIRRLSGDGTTPVYVVGCGATADAERLRTISGVAAVLGHDVDTLHELRTRLAGPNDAKPDQAPPNSAAADVPQTARFSPEDSWHDVWMIAPAQPPDDIPPSRRTNDSALRSISLELPIVKREASLVTRIERFEGHQRAFLKIQDGCDAHCTYCIIPRLRPALRSKPVEVAVAEARSLVASGHREIILTGIFLGAYGRETAIRKRFAPGASPLAQLVRALSGLDGLERLRLSSLEPGDVNDDLLDALASSETCVPHLHLPLQSGSGETLRRMNRQYTREDFIDMIDRVRAALDRPAITTDIIVGFPGETDADFAASVELARYAGFCKIHAFPFSPREKTAAARWKREFVPGPVARARMNALAELERELSLAYRSQFIGETERVIVEGPGDSLPPFQGEIEGGSIRSPSNANGAARQDGTDGTNPGATGELNHRIADGVDFRAANFSSRGRSDSMGLNGQTRASDLHPAERQHSDDDDTTDSIESDELCGFDDDDIRSGRADRYFEIHFDADGSIKPGDVVSVRIDRVTPTRTHGTLTRRPDGSRPLPVLSG